MQGNIIYQVQDKPSEDNLEQKPKKQSWLCCLRACSLWMNFKKKEKPQYQIEIDTPKYQSPVNKRLHKKSLVLDLDETLVHSSFKDNCDYDFSIQIKVQGIDFKIYISVRPGAYEFIEALAEHFELILFTASLKEYADPVMDILDRKRLSSRRLFREHCMMLDNSLVKDLRIIRKDLGNVIIIDNSELSFRLQPENAIHIKDYFYDKTDDELMRLVPFLIWLSAQGDVRPIWKLKAQFDNTFQQAEEVNENSLNLEQQFEQYENQQRQSIESRTKLSRHNSQKPLLVDQEKETLKPVEELVNKTTQKSSRGKIKALEIDIDVEQLVAQNINSPQSNSQQLDDLRDNSETRRDEQPKKSMETQDIQISE